MSGREHSQEGPLQEAAGNLQTARGDVLRRAAWFLTPKQDGRTRLHRLFALWAAGGILLTGVTWLCFKLGLNFSTAVSAFLIVIVLLSLMDSFISSAVFSLAAIVLLNYFFVEPLYTFDVASLQDVLALIAFLLCSLAVTGLVRRLRDLAERQREQARLLELTTDAVVVRGMAGVISYWNRGAEALYGWSRAEAIGKAAHDLLHTVFPAPLTEIDDALRRAGRWEGELTHTTRDGAKVHVAARWSLQTEEGGQAIGVLASDTDITQRRRAEEALRRSQAAYLSEAQKLSHTGSFGWTVSTGEVFWSDETFRIFGYDPTMTPSIGMVLQRVHPEDAAFVQQVIEDAATNGQGFDVEHRLLMPDGSVRHVRAVAHAAPNGSDALRYIGAVSDITASKETYAALERSEQRYRDVFRHMPIGLLQVGASDLVVLLRDLRAQGVTDLGAYIDAHPEFLRQATDALVIDDANEHAVRIYGAKSAADLVGTRTSPHWEAGLDTARRMLEGRYRGDQFFLEETKLTTLDGRVVDILLSVARSGAHADKSLVGIIDITERVRALEMLARVQADFAHAARVSVLGELTASIAHEVNQPLAAIAANGEVGLRWLGRPEPDLAELRELTESIVADARRAADIIARIRLMAARKTPEQTLLSLDEVVREALLFLRHEVQSRAVSVLHLPAPGAPPVRGDRTQLHQVIVNLAVNAMQAMAQAEGRPHRIVIRTIAADPATLRCTVEDSGPGLEAAHLTRLFDSFFSTKQGGMGMGLSICRSIIEAHGGCITADNEATIGGARFAFTLPAASSTGTAP